MAQLVHDFMPGSNVMETWQSMELDVPAVTGHLVLANAATPQSPLTSSFGLSVALSEYFKEAARRAACDPRLGRSPTSIHGVTWDSPAPLTNLVSAVDAGPAPCCRLS